ncbi:MAG: nuclease-related domain-containing protein [Solirubrobacteraceae bacterium]
MADEFPQRGGAGASARAEADRIRARRRQSAGSSLTARVLRAVIGPTTAEQKLIESELRWASGARGEQMLAETLARRCPKVPLLHDRRIPGSRANIDHLAFAPSGIYVIDTKRYRGAIRVEKPLFGSPKLRIGGRDRTRLIDGLDRQVAVVRSALVGVADEVPVHGCLCFVVPDGLLGEVGLPAFRTLRINGYPLYHSRRLARRLNRAGPLSREQATALQAELGRRLPPAVLL